MKRFLTILTTNRSKLKFIGTTPFHCNTVKNRMSLLSKYIEIKVSLLIGFFIFTFFICGGILIHPDTFAQDYRISYDNGLITLSVNKVDIKTILLGISKETNIFIQFPEALKKKITIKLSNVSIRDALKRLLKNQDYAIIYSALKKNNRVSISEVYVLPEKWGNRKPSRSQTLSRREESILRSYNRRLDSLRNQLKTVARGSDTERRILSKIQSIEKRVETMGKKLLGDSKL